MRLQTYLNEAVSMELLSEAKVKVSDADVFLNAYASIFMYDPKYGFLWSVYDKEEKTYKYYKGSKQFGKNKIRPDDYISHGHLIHIFTKGKLESDDDMVSFIRGRISPDGKTIYVHSMDERDHDMSPQQYKYLLKKTIDNVYEYMSDYIKWDLKNIYKRN